MASVVWRALIGLVCLALVGCSSSDETASDGVDPEAVPAEVANLVAEWKQAAARRDGSVIELYTPNGYHLYETQKVTGEDLVSHLESPGEIVEEVTELLLLVEQQGRYVVAQGLRFTVPSVTEESSVTWEIVATADGELRIAQSAWFGSAR